MTECLYFLDAMTRGKGLRMTAVDTSCEPMLRDLSEWMSSNQIRPRDIKYVDIFERNGEGGPTVHIGTMVVNKDNNLELVGTPGSRKKPFQKSGIRRWLSRWMR